MDASWSLAKSMPLPSITVFIHLTLSILLRHSSRHSTSPSPLCLPPFALARDQPPRPPARRLRLRISLFRL
eukprot:5242751-Pleurochrysis_carterae.AAC.1